MGLALAGGGFRASLFHLGVLRRLAELDLLRRIEHLSTVSGGSIVGALYVLLLKRELERSPDGRLTREEYVEIVRELEQVLVRGVRRNLRTLLLVNPLGTLRVLLTGDSLARRMSRLYERHLFEAVAQDLEGYRERPLLERWLRPGRIALTDLRIRPGGRLPDREFSAYNRDQLDSGGSVLTALVLNATSLNSGTRFWFSAGEVGDWQLGAFRADEISRILARKRLLHDLAEEDVEELALGGDTEEGDIPGSDDDHRTASLALWWRRGGSDVEELPAGWEALFEVQGFPGRLPSVELGALRPVKVEAWCIRELSGSDRVIRDEDVAIHRARFHQLLADLDRDLVRSLRAATEASPELELLLVEFILELYWLRTGERASPDLEKDWGRLTVAEAVGASACFPPVFPPMVIHGLYEDAFVSRLSLTDGGVFDNMGITALLDEGCTQIIASDTGGLFREEQAAPADHVSLVLRVPEILRGALAGLQRLYVRERRRLSQAVERSQPDGRLADFCEVRRLDGLAYFHIQSPPIAVRSGPDPIELPTRPRDVASLRTDLDGFGEIEVRALVNHGYATADRYVREHLSAMLPPEAARVPPSPPATPVGGDRVDEILLAGRARFFRTLRLREPVSLLLAAAALLFPPILILGSGLTLADVGAAIAAAVGWWMEILLVPLPEPMEGLVRTFGRDVLPEIPQSAPFLAGVLVAAVGAVLWSASRSPLRESAPDVTKVKGLRRRRRVAEFLRSSKWNVLWLVAALPLLLSFAASAVAAVGWMVSRYLFLRVARIRADDERGGGDTGR